MNTRTKTKILSIIVGRIFVLYYSFFMPALLFYADGTPIIIFTRPKIVCFQLFGWMHFPVGSFLISLLKFGQVMGIIKTIR